MNKKKIIGIIILIPLVLVLLWLTYLYFHNINTFKFKKFTFEVPENMKFDKMSYDEFKITYDGLEAVVDIYYDEEGDVHSQEAVRTALLTENGINVSSSSKERIKDTDILCFNKKDTTELLCYFDTFSPFAYEVTLKNSTNVVDLEPIVEVLLNGEYNYESDKEYEYWDTYGKLSSNLE